MGGAGWDSWSLVVAAKLAVPTPRSDTIVRERLVARLDEALQRPLTVVCAPAGFGKTTAVTTWLGTVEDKRAWVSLDELDNDGRRLCAHLLAALDGALPGADAIDEARRALVEGSDLVDTVVPLVAGALAARLRGRLAFVLDDYHVIEHPSCHAFISALIDALPSAARMVLCSRSMPPLRIARRRVLDTVAEVDWHELAFDGGESERLLNDSLGLGLDHGVVEAIQSRVEGWPAGLALVASSLRGREHRARYLEALGQRHPDVSGTGVAAFLTEEVLERAAPRMREFLYRTAILERLGGALCAAVLDDPAAHDLLDEVRRSNLFVTVLDDEPGSEWLRYHHLFAELLERELHAKRPHLADELHHRAARWFAGNGWPEEAIAHATAAGDGELAAALLQDCWRTLMVQWRYVTIRRMIARMPPERGELAAFCEALDIVCWSLEGADMRLVAQRLDVLEPLRDAPGVAPIIDRMRVSPYYGDIGHTLTNSWAVWERHHDLGFRTEVAGQFGMTLWLAGDSNAAREIIEPFLYEMRGPASRAWAFGTLALIAADEGDVELAVRYGREAVEAIPKGGGTLTGHLAPTALAEALRLQGAFEEAAEQLAHADRLTSHRPISFYHAVTLVFEARLVLSMHGRAAARESARRARALVDRYPDPGTLADRLAGVEALLEQRVDGELRGTPPTTAELRVLALLATDLTIKQIAEQLFLSVKTVGAHRRRIYLRLGAASREDAVATARRRGLL
jgi:LuxR family maltose regulon positive regulatory protein